MERPSFASRKRTYLLTGIIVLLIAVLGIRLYQLQFLEYSTFRSTAESNSIRRLAKDPLRGMIYDRNGNLIVGNNPSYTMTITPFEFQEESLPLLKRLFDVDTNVVRYRISQAGKNSFVPVKVSRDLSFEQISLLEEFRTALQGVDYTVESRRVYHQQPRLAHLLGYTKEISPGYSTVWVIITSLGISSGSTESRPITRKNCVETRVTAIFLSIRVGES
jgi:penicillin-binding protein 2